MLRQQLIDCLKAQGADLVGFAPIARFDGTPAKALLPTARTVIGVAFRVLRGAHRGIEEGTTYYQYTTNGVEVLEEVVMPMAMLRACSVLEEAGYLALPQRRTQLVTAGENDTNPELLDTEIYRGKANEQQLNFEDAAVRCGLGELGEHGQLLTDDFGPFQRLCFILTDAELTETPVAAAHICDHCGACRAACPGHALAVDGTRNDWQCAAYYRGAARAKNPFMPPDAYKDLPDREAILAGTAQLTPDAAKAVLDETFFYPSIRPGYSASICGRACCIACYIHLEEKGALRKTFRTQFRKRPDWHLSDL